MLTAKDSEIDKVVGLEIGADDYVTKPYSSPRAAGPHQGGAAAAGRARGPACPPTLEAGPVRMDVERHTVTVRGGRDVVAAQGVRAAGDAAAQRRPGAHPDAAHRPGLGQRLRRRHQDPRRPRQAAAREDRARPGQPARTSSPCAGSATSSRRRSAPAHARVSRVWPSLRSAAGRRRGDRRGDRGRSAAGGRRRARSWGRRSPSRGRSSRRAGGSARWRRPDRPGLQHDAGQVARSGRHGVDLDAADAATCWLPLELHGRAVRRARLGLRRR